MTTATQAQVRSWARSKGLTVNDRGSLPVSVTQAYAAAHTRSTKGTTVTSPARKRTAAKPTARKTTARKKSASAAKAPRARKAAPKARKAAPKQAVAAPAVQNTAPAAGSADLAGGLRSYLGSIDAEVRAVSSLSERIDALVTDLNDLRDQQAKRLIVLDKLRASVSDKTLGSFLDQAIKPRKTRVAEVVPDRLS